MKILLFTLLMVFMTGLNPIQAQKDSNVFPFEYKKVQLENGFTAYLIDAGGPGQIAYLTVVRTGSRDEWEPGRSGYAHFFEHMMFRGTEKYPDFDAVTTPIGADMNAFTGSDLTAYYLVTANDSLEQLIDLESDRFMNLDYSEADFRTEAGAILGEFNQGRANPFMFLYEKLRDTAFDQHTYKHTTIGFEQDVRQMPEGFEYSRSFFKRYYRPENCVLLISGDFDLQKAEELIRKYYGPWEPGYVAPEIQPEPRQTVPRQAEVEFPGRTLPTISINYKGPAWSATDRLTVAATVLGEVAFGENSEVYRRLVLQEQKAQTIFADFEPLRDPYLLDISAMVNSEDDLEPVTREILATVEKYREELCDEQRLADTISALRYGFLNQLETARGTAFALLNYVVNTGGIEAVEDYYQTLQTITPDDLREAARTYLVEETRTTVTLLPAKEGR
ncbi:MAG: insulinase family protein [Acidobacteriota bacterium]|nr:MAG: insulinase family protein [Acidobacteriota bacterium]